LQTIVIAGPINLFDFVESLKVKDFSFGIVLSNSMTAMYSTGHFARAFEDRYSLGTERFVARNLANPLCGLL